MSRTPVTEGGAAAATPTEAASGRCPDLQAAEMPVVLIPVDLIDVPLTRLRSIKLTQADAIGASIIAHGQYDPITVAPAGARFTLVDGLHRLEGCRLHEVVLIEARVTTEDAAARLRQEVLSAWARAEHDAFDRAAQIEAMASLANGLAENIENEDEASAMMALATGWDVAACETLGIGRRSLFRHLKIHRFFDVSQKSLLRGLDMAAELVPLERLASLTPKDFARAMGAIETGEVVTIAEALALVAEAATASPFAKKSNAFLTFLRAKATPRERADLMRQLADEYQPNGLPKAKAKG